MSLIVQFPRVSSQSLARLAGLRAGNGRRPPMGRHPEEGPGSYALDADKRAPLRHSEVGRTTLTPTSPSSVMMSPMAHPRTADEGRDWRNRSRLGVMETFCARLRAPRAKHGRSADCPPLKWPLGDRILCGAQPLSSRAKSGFLRGATNISLLAWLRAGGQLPHEVGEGGQENGPDVRRGGGHTNTWLDSASESSDLDEHRCFALLWAASRALNGPAVSIKTAQL